MISITLIGAGLQPGPYRNAYRNVHTNAHVKPNDPNSGATAT
jgi:hypothetical protein